jgi:hypothetical protein
MSVFGNMPEILTRGSAAASVAQTIPGGASRREMNNGAARTFSANATAVRMDFQTPSFSTVAFPYFPAGTLSGSAIARRRL